jgi:hypothetical protein
MKVFAVVVALMNLAGDFPSSAQLAIQNPHHLPVPEQKASVLMSTACRVIAEHLRWPKERHATEASATSTSFWGDQMPLVYVTAWNAQNVAPDMSSGSVLTRTAPISCAAASGILSYTYSCAPAVNPSASADWPKPCWPDMWCRLGLINAATAPQEIVPLACRKLLAPG